MHVLRRSPGKIYDRESAAFYVEIIRERQWEHLSSEHTTYTRMTEPENIPGQLRLRQPSVCDVLLIKMALMIWERRNELLVALIF